MQNSKYEMSNYSYVNVRNSITVPIESNSSQTYRVNTGNSNSSASKSPIKTDSQVKRVISVDCLDGLGSRDTLTSRATGGSRFTMGSRSTVPTNNAKAQLMATLAGLSIPVKASNAVLKKYQNGGDNSRQGTITSGSDRTLTNRTDREKTLLSSSSRSKLPVNTSITVS
jgi:hypothetical protein